LSKGLAGGAAETKKPMHSAEGDIASRKFRLEGESKSRSRRGPAHLHDGMKGPGEVKKGFSKRGEIEDLSPFGGHGRGERTIKSRGDGGRRGGFMGSKLAKGGLGVKRA